MLSSSSSSTTDHSSSSAATRAIYSEIARTRSFLDGLGQLPRPQATIEDAQFLTYYSLKAQKLTLSDILSHCSLSYVDPLEEFPVVSSHSSVLFHKVPSEDTTPVPAIVPYNPKLHLNNKLLGAKQDQLRSLKHLYESEIQWLSLSSRLWIGPIRGRHVAILIDFTDSVCLNSNMYTRYLSVLHVLVDEQIGMMDVVYLCPLGTVPCEPVVFDVRHWDNVSTLRDIKRWMMSVKAQGSCNLLSGLKSILQLSKNKKIDIDTIAVLLCSRPNQKLPVMYDHLIQLMTGLSQRPHFHFTTISTDEDVQISLKQLASELRGHYHQLTFHEGKPLMEDTLINEIDKELTQVREISCQLENIKKNVFDESLLEALRQLMIVSDWPRDDTFTPPTSPTHDTNVTTTSEVWLEQRGIDPSGLNLYQQLAPDAYKQISEHVSLIDKSATSSVYNFVMPQLLWNDGTYKYLYVNVNRLRKYLANLKELIGLYGRRMSWLKTGSRVPFGNISEKRIIILFDGSVKTGLHLTQLQTHLKSLLHEQVSKLEAFDLICITEKLQYWNGSLVKPTRDSLAEAWKWILHVNPSGTCNLLNALRTILESPAYNCPFGLYVILSNMPDQNEVTISSYLEQKVTGKTCNVHFILYQPIVTDRWAEVSLNKGTGRHGDTQGIANTLKQIASRSEGSYHQFHNGVFVESSDQFLLDKELTRANSYFETIRDILDDYINCFCKRNVKREVTTSVEDSTQQHRTRMITHPIYPRPTLTSVARLNCTALKLKEKERSSTCFLKPKTKGPFLTCHCYYLGRGLRKGLYYELMMDSDVCSHCNKPLIPSAEELIPTAEWLEKYSLKTLHLYNKKLFKECKDGHKHVTSDGHIVELNISHQQLNKRLKLLRIVRTRYIQRLKWLLDQDSNRAVFGCVTGKKLVLLIDVSSSMKEQEIVLKDHLVSLINEQLTRRNINSFNIVAFATEVLPWRPSLVLNTNENRNEAIEWVWSLSFGGCSNLYEAIKLSLQMKGQSLYLISDGDTDHTASFLIGQVKELQKKFTHPWTIHCIAYQSTKHDSLKLLQDLASITKGRYWFHPLKVPSDPSTLVPYSKTLKSHLGDDLHLLLEEIHLTDHAIQQSLYHLGR